MGNPHLCSQCGSPLPRNMLEGICADCLRRRVTRPAYGTPSSESEEPAAMEAERVGPSDQGPAPTFLGARIGRYRLLKQLGEGGFGRVYLAEQTEPVRRQVALKVIKLGMDTEQVVARFEAERQALALMTHPNIARVLDAGTIPPLGEGQVLPAGRPYFVMELVDGVSITQYCENHILPTTQRLKLFILVCQAVQHAHQKGIIHRDLKPSNILVTLHEGMPLPKVIDFGIAKATQMELTEKTLYTQLNHFVGTPAYMSPEQLEMSGADVDTRSDVYSLGVLLYELLTGLRPLDTTNLSYEQVCHRIRLEEPLKPSTRLKTQWAGRRGLAGKGRPLGWAALRREIRGDLDQVVMKALDKDRTRRYETANALAMDIARFLNHEPVLAVAPSPLYRFHKWVRRNRGVFAAVTVVFMVLILGAILSTWQAIRATRSEREQSRLRQQAQAQAYAADMNLAQQAYSLHNLGRTKDLLLRHRPATGLPGQAAWPDLRGWEWRYLWQQSQGGTRDTLCQVSNGVFSMSFSYDGQWAAVGERLGGLTVWDVPAKTKIATLWQSAELIRVAFSPQERLLAYAIMEPGASSLYLWDGAAREVVAQRRLNGGCSGLAFSPDGSKLLVFTHAASDQVSILKIPDGTLLSSFSAPGIETDWTGNLNATAVDFTLAAHRYFRNQVRIFDTATGAQRRIMTVQESLVVSLAFSPDTKLLAAATGLDQGVIYVWDVDTGQQIARWDAHRGYISRLKFWPDGKTLASAGADQSIGLWDLSNLPDVPEPRRLVGHLRVVLDLDLLPGATTLASSSEDGSVLLWDTSKDGGGSNQLILTNRVVGWSFGPDSKSILTADAGGKVIQWRGADFQDNQVMLDANMETGAAVFSKDLRRVAITSVSGNLQVWDCASGQLLKGYPPETTVLSPRSFLLRGERLMVYDHQDSRIKELELPSGQEMGSWQSGSKRIAGLLSPNERWLIRVLDSDQILLTDRETDQDVVLEPRMPAAEGAAFTADGRHVCVTSWRGFARVWEVGTGRLVATFEGFLMGVHSAGFSPDGKRLATTSTGEEAVKLWDMESLQELLTLPAPTPTFISTQFSPDGSILGAMDYKAKLHLWRAPSWAEIQAAEE